MKGSLGAIISNYKGRTAEVVRQSCNILATRVISRTPVQHGSLRASWNPSTGAPVFSNVDTKLGGDDAPNRNKLAAIINKLMPGDKFCLANGQPYVRRIEYEGHSMQAPQGMMRRSIQEWDEIVRQAINDSKK